MRLIRLALENFRLHADTHLEFRQGLTGIIGPNGSGKTTILEGIAWTIYGAAAARGTKDTLRFNRAAGRSAVRAELEFELGDERYRVTRTQRHAELFRAESPDPIAAGLNEVTRQLQVRLGMTRQEFFNTYFTGQKQLQFLAAMGPTERARFLSQVLGYERLRRAQELVRDQRKVLKGQVEELRRALRDPEELAAAKRDAERRVKEVNDALAVAEERSGAAAKALAEVEPTWKELQKARERERMLKEELRVAGTRLERALQAEAHAEAELAELKRASQRLAELRERIKPLEGLGAEEEEQRKLAEAASRREGLEKQLREQRERVATLSRRAAEHEAKGRERDELTEKLAASDAECERLESARDDARSRWERDSQDVEARLRMLRSQAEDLQRQIELLEGQGPEGVCPTCKRALGAEYDRVLTHVRGQYEEVVQDGKWHKARLDQLKKEPQEVRGAREAFDRAREARERVRDRLGEAEAALRQAEVFREEKRGEEARARELAGAMAALPEGYDAERHARLKEELSGLRELEKEVTQLETRLEREARVKAARAEAREEERQIRGRMGELEAERSELGFSEESYEAMGERHESARTALEAARLELERIKGEAEAARGAAEAARRAEQESKELSRAISERESDHRLHNELDGALGELREELNDRVRPELSEIASVFMTELTDGRYNRIEINRDYDVVVLDDGEEKPVISGGEEDLANLVLRLAISQMIADRAGQTLSLLIFDEVFGGLDELRRDSVVRLLQRLQDRFEQVILITHIESIREGMDHVARVSYDEATGTSVIRDESPGAGPGDLEAEDLAALVAE